MCGRTFEHCHRLRRIRPFYKLFRCNSEIPTELGRNTRILYDSSAAGLLGQSAMRHASTLRRYVEQQP